MAVDVPEATSPTLPDVLTDLRRSAFMTDPALDAATAKLTADGAASSVIAAFIDRYNRLASGETGLSLIHI